MSITIIGTGNVAVRLAEALYLEGYAIAQIYGRTEESAKTLADAVNTSYTTKITDIRKDSDVYIFSVKDSALSEVLEQFPPVKGLLVHTAGSIPIDVFSPYSDYYGVIYPLQTLSKERKIDFKKVPLCIEASDEKGLKQLTDLAKTISDNVLFVNSEQRQYLHLAAVFACNFVNGMYDIASEILQQQGFPFEILLPLIDETARKVHSLSPFDAQTCPAVRNDRNIMEKHLSLLKNETLKEIYELMSRNIYERHEMHFYFATS